MITKCNQCGAEVQSYLKNAKTYFCPDECKRVYRNIRNFFNKLNNHEYYKLKYGILSSHIVNCGLCGVSFYTTTTAKYCVECRPKVAVKRATAQHKTEKYKTWRRMYNHKNAIENKKTREKEKFLTQYTVKKLPFNISICTICGIKFVNKYVQSVCRLSKCRNVIKQLRREKRNVGRKLNYRKRIEIDPKFKIVKNMTSAIGRTINDKNMRKWETLVGYTREDLMIHLELQFTNGMSWNNYGSWHIDHIRPIASFTFNSYADDGFKQCWRLENLQPLWAVDNILKGDTWMTP